MNSAGRFIVFNVVSRASVLSLLMWIALTGSVVSPGLAQYANVRVSSPLVSDPNEVVIAINPTNPQNLLAASNLRYFYSSMDGGLSWSQGQLPSGTWGDPCVIFDLNGRAYYSHLSNPVGGYFIERLIVHRSSNGGASWYDSVDVGYNPPRQQDKEWMAVDETNSPYRNNLYMAWTEFDALESTNPADSTRILFSRSTNGGDTWMIPLRISDEGGNCLDGDNTVEGAVPAVGPGGEVYVAWSGPRGIMFDRSLDGGLTFGRDVFVAEQPGGWAFDVPGMYRCNGLPITACDVSQSPYRGTVYVCWSDQRHGEDDTDVFLSKSTDGGITWSPATRVNDDMRGRQQFFPWLAIDQSAGVLYCVFYDRRNTVGDATDVYLAISRDGGETFQNSRVSKSSFVPDPAVFFGDYIGIAARDRHVYPIWARMDKQARSVWAAAILDTPDVTASRVLLNFPNPFSTSTIIRYDLAYEASVRIEIFNLLGQPLAVLRDGVEPEGRHEVTWRPDVPSGVYFCRAQINELGGPQRSVTDVRRLLLLK